MCTSRSRTCFPPKPVSPDTHKTTNLTVRAGYREQVEDDPADDGACPLRGQVQSFADRRTTWPRLAEPRRSAITAATAAQPGGEAARSAQRGKRRDLALTRIWHPCRACGRRAPRRLRPRPPRRGRAAAPGTGAVDTGGEPDPYPRGVDCDEDRGRRGHRVDRTALRLHRHHRPRGNPRAARHRRTVITKCRIDNDD